MAKPKFFKVKGWATHQHYKDRNPPWIKFQRTVLDDYEIGCLQDASKAHLFSIWLLAARYDNRVPYDADWIAAKINATEKVDLETLQSLGFIELYDSDSEALAERKQNDDLEREAETERETEKERNRGGAVAPRSRKSPERKSRLANDWKPSEQDCDYARGCNLTDAETHGIAEQFRRYFTGPDAKNPRKSDWHRAWCNWVDRDAARVIANRSRASGPSRNRPEPSSTLAAFASVAAQMADENERSRGMGRGFEGLSNQSDSEPSGCSERDCDGANHATADAADRVCEAACGVENPHEIEGGKSAGFASDGSTLRPQVIDLPGRRGAQGFDDTGRPDALLARVGGTEGPSGFVREAAHETLGGADSVEGENLTHGAKVNAAATHAPIDGDSLSYGQKNGVSVEVKAA
jgi:hypothetical protein